MYALPRTELEVVQPVKLKVPTHGLLANTVDSCRRACKATDGNVRDDACSFSIAPSLSFLPSELRTTAVADLERQYQVRPSAGMFQSTNFKLENASNGVLDNMDSSQSNLAYEVLSDGLKVAVKLAAMAMPSMVMATDMKNIPNGKRSKSNCYDTSVQIASLAESKEGTLSCSLLDEIDTCMDPYLKEVTKQKSALNDLFHKAETQKIDAKLLANIAANRREQLDAAVAKRDDAASIYGLDAGKDKEASYQIILPMGGPPEFTGFTSKASMTDIIKGGHARIAATSDNGAEMMGTLAALAKEQTRYYVATSTMPARISFAMNLDAEPQGNGYKYRVPVLAQTSLTVYKDKDEKQEDKVFGPVIDRKIIAQYGPIAAMPSTFYGKGGKVALKLWPESGALKVVEVGADAIPASSVTGVLDEVYTQRKARQDKADARAAADAGKDAEVDALTRQKTLLDLKKQIKDLESELAK